MPSGLDVPSPEPSVPERFTVNSREVKRKRADADTHVLYDTRDVATRHQITSFTLKPDLSVDPCPVAIKNRA